MAKRTLAIVGQTASGKSELAIKLAELFDGEIICADAWTVRKQANIGTAKPSKSEMAKIPHHLVDIIEPDEKFSAADFKDLANDAVIDIQKRNKLPIMVGGSGLYIDGFLYDYSFLETTDTSKRDKLSRMTKDELLDLLKKLNVDVKLNNSDLNNKRRLIRLIETHGEKATKNELRKDTLIIGLDVPKEILEERIKLRVNTMLSNGLMDEVYNLSQKYGWGTEALKAVGYNEWHDYFLGSLSEQKVKEIIIKNTLNLAKRQRTWFRRNKSIQWFTTPVKYTDIVDTITTFLES